MSRQQPDDRGEVILYRTEDGRTALDVRLAGETVWLTQTQIAELFAVNTPAISKHIKNIYTARELTRKATVSKMETVRTEGKRQVARNVEIYNLDMIIAVGYRVNSTRATRFRIWATQTLKDHLIRGYTLNERRLREKGLAEAEQAIQLLSRTLTQHQLVNAEGRGVLEVVSRYAKSWLLLKEYDEDQLTVPEQRKPARTALDYVHTREAIDTLKARLLERNEATHLFGQERGESLAGILGSIEQTFDGHALYPSIEEKGRTCSISSSRTTPSLMATNASARSCSSCSSARTVISKMQTAKSKSTTTHWSHSPCSLRRANRATRN